MTSLFGSRQGARGGEGDVRFGDSTRAGYWRAIVILVQYTLLLPQTGLDGLDR